MNGGDEEEQPLAVAVSESFQGRGKEGGEGNGKKQNWPAQPPFFADKSELR